MSFAKFKFPFILLALLFFMMSVTDASAVRRSLRIDFDAWSATQTIAPANIVIPTSAPNLGLSWDAIEYTDDAGRYRAWYSTSPAGPFIDGGAPAPPLDTSLTISGLLTNTSYYAILRTETDAHGNNSNHIESEDSESRSNISNGVFSSGFE